MAPTTQAACIVPEEKQLFKIVKDWPVPMPGPKEVLIKLLAVGLNPVDAYIPGHGMPFVTKYPWLGGYDGAGIVEEIGSEVKTFKKGDRVFAPGDLDPRRAFFQQYAIVLEGDLAKIPDNITFDQAATIPLCFATAIVGLWAHHPNANSISLIAPWEEGGLTKYVGQPALISGASTCVGQYALQMAKYQGFSPIIATSSLRHESFLKSIGATHVIDRSLANDVVLAEIQKITGGKPVAYAFCAFAFADEPQHLTYDALGPNGSLIITNPAARPVLAAKVERDGGTKKVAYPSAFWHLPEHIDLWNEVRDRQTEWLQTGVLVPARVEVVPGGLAGIPVGCARLLKGEVSGVKLVVHPQDPESA